MIIIKEMFVLQNNDADDFVNFIIENHPYQGIFDADMKQIRLYLKTALEKELSKTEDILKFMLNNLEYEFQIPSSNTKFTCSDYFEKWLNQIKDQNKNVPNIGFDTTDILIAILAFTGTGISWIIWGLQKHSKFSEFHIGTGIINIFIFILFIASLYFSWVLAVQIILGILFALLAIVTALMAISNLFKNRDDRRKNAKFNWAFMQDRIADMRKYLDQIKSKSEQDKNNESDKENEKIENNLGIFSYLYSLLLNTDNNFPDLRESKGNEIE